MTDFLPGPIHTEEHVRQRRLERRRRRRRRRIAFIVIVVVVVAAIVAAVVLATGHKGEAKPKPAGTHKATPSAKPKASHTASPTSGAQAAASVSPSPAATATTTTAQQSSSAELAGASRPRIVQDPVPYGPARKAEMAQYSLKHYGQDTWVLRPSAIVLHYTAGPSYSAAHATFESNATNLGELPGVASHFIIDKDGTIYQQVPLDVRCRHTIGLNHCAVGIEFVQEATSSPSTATAAIFARKAQLGAGLRLVAWLQAKYGIADRNVIGHGMANSSPLFKDLEGWRNDHVDWEAPAVARFQGLLDQMK